MTGFGYRADWRLSWMTHAESFWDTPLQMRYTSLDPSAQYRIRVVYAGDVFSMNTQIRLVANDTFEVHPPMNKPSPIKPVEFDIPAEATRAGQLTLTFSAPAGMGSAGRGNQIAEVWLMRKVMSDDLGEPDQRAGCAESQPVFGCTITTPSLDMAARAATRGLPFSLAGDGALADHARDGAQHRARRRVACPPCRSRACR